MVRNETNRTPRPSKRNHRDADADATAQLGTHTCLLYLYDLHDSTNMTPVYDNTSGARESRTEAMRVGPGEWRVRCVRGMKTTERNSGHGARA
jgi:sarcosine oxidase gamma subunit